MVGKRVKMKEKECERERECEREQMSLRSRTGLMESDQSPAEAKSECSWWLLVILRLSEI